MKVKARDKAHSLNYHVIRAQDAHAEMQLLQFLQYHKHYKVIAMQCSRDYCFRCYFVLTEHPRTKMCANGIKQDQIEGRKCGKIFPILKSILTQLQSVNNTFEKILAKLTFMETMKEIIIFDSGDKINKENFINQLFCFIGPITMCYMLSGQ